MAKKVRQIVFEGPLNQAVKLTKKDIKQGMRMIYLPVETNFLSRLETRARSNEVTSSLAKN